MSINTAVQQLLDIEASKQGGAYSPDTLAVGMSRLGAPDQQIVAGSMQQLLDVDFGAPLHCLVIAGRWTAGLGWGWGLGCLMACCEGASPEDCYVCGQLQKCWFSRSPGHDMVAAHMGYAVLDACVVLTILHCTVVTLQVMCMSWRRRSCSSTD